MTASATNSNVSPATPARIMGYWLLGICSMVFVMVVLGGYTRLTESGLSMTGWRPVTGWLPPMSVDEWQLSFDAYRTSPEYQKVNRGMSLDEYKEIFWLEYLHRLWGRIIGIAFALPFLFFAIKGWLNRQLTIRFTLLLALGGFQGVIGWWMVKSGLVDRPDVSQYRLAIHLIVAFVIISLALWFALDLLDMEAKQEVPRWVRKLTNGCIAIAFVTVFSGALVAGLNAGMIYNTFPLMMGDVFPPEGFDLSPWYLNFFEDIPTVQFDHRVLAITTFLVVGVIWFNSRGLGWRLRSRANFLMGVAVLQVTLGISTLLLVVPLNLAVAHQAGAVVLVCAAIWFRHGIKSA